jgi:hypothetical protein
VTAVVPAILLTVDLDVLKEVSKTSADIAVVADGRHRFTFTLFADV